MYFLLFSSFFLLVFFFFFFNDTATTEIYTLSLHDALPIYSLLPSADRRLAPPSPLVKMCRPSRLNEDRKSTRLNSSHSQISYAVFCLKKKKKKVLRSAEHLLSDIVPSFTETTSDPTVHADS